MPPSSLVGKDATILRQAAQHRADVGPRYTEDMPKARGQGKFNLIKTNYQIAQRQGEGDRVRSPYKNRPAQLHDDQCQDHRYISKMTNKMAVAEMTYKLQGRGKSNSRRTRIEPDEEPSSIVYKEYAERAVNDTWNKSQKFDAPPR